MFRKPEPSVASSGVGSSRSKYDARFHVAENNSVFRLGDSEVSGPLRNRFAWPQESRRTMAGALPECVDALNAGADPLTSIARDHALAVGCRGVNVTAMPGAPRSIGIMPVATSACSHT